MQKTKQPTFTVEAMPIEIISLNDLIRYGMMYLEQHPEIPATRDVEAVRAIQARLNERATTMMSEAHYAREMQL